MNNTFYKAIIWTSSRLLSFFLFEPISEHVVPGNMNIFINYMKLLYLFSSRAVLKKYEFGKKANQLKTHHAHGINAKLKIAIIKAKVVYHCPIVIIVFGKTYLGNNKKTQRKLINYKINKNPTDHQKH